MNSNQARAVAVLLLLAAPSALLAQDGYLVYVTNEDSNDLSIIDPVTNEVMMTLPVGKRPRGVRVSPDGKYVLTALSGSPKCPPSMPDEQCEALGADRSLDGIALIDAATHGLVRVLPSGSDPEQFDIDPSGDRLVVSNEDAGQASFVDVENGEVIRTVAVGTEPEGVKISPDGSVAAVTSESEHDIAVIDMQTGAVLARVEVGLRPRDVVFTSDGTHALVSSELGRLVAVIDTSNWTVVRRIEISPTALPMGLAVLDDARTLFVANGREGTVSRVDLQGGGVTGTAEVGARPWGIALSPDGTRLYTANGPSNDVTVVDTSDLTVIATIPVGSTPWGVAVGPRP
jgi:YVTN family beta-propeller protein